MQWRGFYGFHGTIDVLISMNMMERSPVEDGDVPPAPPVARVWYLAQRDRQSGTLPLCGDGALSPEEEYNRLYLLVQSLLNSVTKVTPLKKQRNGHFMGLFMFYEWNLCQHYFS